MRMCGPACTDDAHPAIKLTVGVRLVLLFSRLNFNCIQQVNVCWPPIDARDDHPGGHLQVAHARNSTAAIVSQLIKLATQRPVVHLWRGHFDDDDDDDHYSYSTSKLIISHGRSFAIRLSLEKKVVVLGAASTPRPLDDLSRQPNYIHSDQKDSNKPPRDFLINWTLPGLLSPACHRSHRHARLASPVLSIQLQSTLWTCAEIRRQRKSLTDGESLLLR